MQPLNSSLPQVIAFLFCKEVVREDAGEMWPFRIFEGANVSIPQPPQQVTVWQNIPVKVFLGFAFTEGTMGEPNGTSLQVFAADGEELGSTTFEIEAMPNHLTVYRSVELFLPAAKPGVILFCIVINGQTVGSRTFTITHTTGKPEEPAFSL